MILFCGPAVVDARPDNSALCEQAAQAAAIETGVPVAVLQAISLAESGRRQGVALRPWPWAVNMDGDGKWFGSFAEAREFVDNHFQAGARNFDLGCFQINYRWHGQAFDSIDEMFNPLANARYAARFLRQLFGETGDWSIAAGAFHSRTPAFSDPYRERFDRLRAELERGIPAGTPPVAPATRPVPKPHAPRINSFPLLVAQDGSGRLGSLFPMRGQTAVRRLIALERQGS